MTTKSAIFQQARGYGRITEKGGRMAKIFQTCLQPNLDNFLGYQMKDLAIVF